MTITTPPEPPDEPDTDRTLWAFAARQSGAISTAQVFGNGIAPQALTNRVVRGEWTRVGRRVLVHSAAGESDHQRAQAAVLDAGGEAVLSHTSAAALWGLPGFDIVPCHVTISRRSHTVHQSLGTVHRMRALRPHHCTMLEGIPVVRPELLLLQLAGVVHPARVGVLVDRAWSMRLLSGRSTRRVLAEVSGSGVRGVVALRTALRERGDGYTPPATNLESRFAEIIRNAGLPRMRSQVDLGDDVWCGRVDFFAEDCKLVIEVDSEKFHSALSDIRADQLREARLADAGFTVGRVTDQQVFHRPWQVVALVRRLRGVARGSIHN